MVNRFTGQPLIIRVERDENGNWDIRPSKIDFDSATGKSHSQEMNDRAQTHDSDIQGTWDVRRAGGAPPVPHYKQQSGHVPVAVQAGEKVQFRSENNLPFAIWVERDPNVSVITGSPNNPFGFTLPQSCSSGVSPVMTVAANITGQRFYKCTAWVDVGEGQTVVVDPDVIGL